MASMTPEQRAADVITDWSVDPDVIYERVVAAIREAVEEEREACHVACRTIAKANCTGEMMQGRELVGPYVCGALDCAAAIRARQ